MTLKKFIFYLIIMVFLACWSGWNFKEGNKMRTEIPKKMVIVGFVVWPTVFTDPNFKYGNSQKEYGKAIADGLEGWGTLKINLLFSFINSQNERMKEGKKRKTSVCLKH